MHHILQGAGLFIDNQVYFQMMLGESVSHSLLLFVIITWSRQGRAWVWCRVVGNIISRCAFEPKSCSLFYIQRYNSITQHLSLQGGFVVSEIFLTGQKGVFRSGLNGRELVAQTLCEGLSVCKCAQDVETAFRTAAGTSPLLVSLTDTQPTCTASGEYQSHQERRYEHMESARSTLRWLTTRTTDCLCLCGIFTWWLISEQLTASISQSMTRIFI